MYFKIAMLFCVFATVLMVVPLTSTLSNQRLFVCQHGTLYPGEALVEKLFACKENHLSNGYKCISICVAEAVGGLKDGNPDRDLFINIIRAQFPAEVQFNAVAKMEDCFKGKSFDQAYSNCSSVAAIVSCGAELVINTPCQEDSNA